MKGAGTSRSKEAWSMVTARYLEKKSKKLAKDVSEIFFAFYFHFISAAKLSA